MNKYLLRISQTLALLLIGSVVLLYLTRSHPVLLRIPPDDTLRPRYYCVLNPFRDKAPEKLAEHYLNELQAGRVEAIAPFVGERKDIPEKEKQWPIKSWRIGDRNDTTERVTMMYWVKRGNGYANDEYEDAVVFWMNRSGGDWQVTMYSAVY
jgi:hypothetical protein